MARFLGLVALLAGILASTAVGAPGDAERRSINAADQAWAKRVNLTLRDLPSRFERERAHPSSGRLTCPGYAADLSRFTITGEATSWVFTSAGGTSILSAAEIFRTVSDERGDWALTARREALACLRQQLQQATGGTAKVATTIRRAPRVGERAISFRATLSSKKGARDTAWFDVLSVARGRGDATLAVISVPRAPSAALERSLLAKLASRLAG